LDLAGRQVDPLVTTNQATVLIFVGNQCPISNRYVPEMRRLQAAFAGRGVGFWLVHADPQETAAGIAEHDREFGVTIPALRDPHHVLVRLARAEVTPTAAVFAQGKLIYHGRIDDRATELEQERAQATHHDLAAALEAVLAGQVVPIPATQAFGCFIPRAQ
jgi:hypothetical protein